MASRNVIPFNHEPSLLDRKTASYVVPAGKYARAIGSFLPNLGTTATTYTLPKLTVDGNVVLYCNNFTVVNGSTVGGGSTAFTVPSDFSGLMYINTAGITASQMQIKFDGANTSYSSQVNLNNLVLPVKSGTLIQNGTGSSAGAGTYSMWFKSEEPNMIEMWVPSGTTLAGTASTFKWEIELYNEIT